MDFVKMHGTGNDFILVDGREAERDWANEAVAICDRHFGIGADGLILVLPSGVADLRMRIINSDGSEAEMCGNGIRCFAKYAIERGLVPPEQDRLAVETLAGIRTLSMERANGTLRNVTVAMGRPILRPSEIPVNAPGEGPLLDIPLSLDNRKLLLTCVSMGNPHAVAFLEEPVAAFPLERIGPIVEHDPLFPQRVNFEIVNLLDRGRMRVRIWERGAGLTLACGTGVCAAVVAARLHGFVGDTVDVAVPGGDLLIRWDGAREVYLTGPAETVFEGVWRR